MKNSDSHLNNNNASTADRQNQADESSSMSPGIFNIGPEPTTFPKAVPLFRGDSRPFNPIFNEGFKSHGSNMDLSLHAMPIYNSLQNSAYISTSTSIDIAKTFPAQPHKYVYQIETTRPTVDVVKELGSIADHLAYERERAFLSKIYPHEIKGGWEVNSIVDKNHVTHYEFLPHELIPNPNFTPPVYAEKSLWKAGKLLTHGMTAAGVVLDGMSLHQQYQMSNQTGNYDNTYREGARIAGGWTGAWVAGSAFAQIGATVCLPLSPLGQAACGISFGVVGSALGYVYGGDVGTRLYDVNRNIYNSKIAIDESQKTNKESVNINYTKTQLISNHINSLENKLDINPQDFRSYQQLSNLYRKQGNDTLANSLQNVASMLIEGRINAVHYYSLGHQYANLKKAKEADRCYKQSFIICPNENKTNIYYERGIGMTIAGYFQAAIDSYLEYIKHVKNYPQPYHRLGELFIIQKEYNRAIDCLTIACKLSDPRSMANKAAVVQLKQAQDSLTRANEALFDGAESGDVQLIQEALNNGADLDALSLDGANVLDFAIVHNRLEAVKYLTAKGLRPIKANPATDYTVKKPATTVTTTPAPVPITQAPQQPTAAPVVAPAAPTTSSLIKQEPVVVAVPTTPVATEPQKPVVITAPIPLATPAQQKPEAALIPTAQANTPINQTPVVTQPTKPAIIVQQKPMATTPPATAPVTNAPQQLVVTPASTSAPTPAPVAQTPVVAQTKPTVPEQQKPVTTTPTFTQAPTPAPVKQTPIAAPTKPVTPAPQKPVATPAPAPVKQVAPAPVKQIAPTPPKPAPAPATVKQTAPAPIKQTPIAAPTKPVTPAPQKPVATPAPAPVKQVAKIIPVAIKPKSISNDLLKKQQELQKAYQKELERKRIAQQERIKKQQADHKKKQEEDRKKQEASKKRMNTQTGNAIKREIRNGGYTTLNKNLSKYGVSQSMIGQNNANRISGSSSNIFNKGTNLYKNCRVEEIGWRNRPNGTSTAVDGLVCGSTRNVYGTIVRSWDTNRRSKY